ncbi:MAG: preprotein translocase subunit SecG [Eubacteriales bacterium]|nr:preprotein translocase subunit SecG [Eubacteriales bacterium]
MDILRTVLSIIFAIDCVALVVVVLMQEGKDRGLGALAGVSNTDTYWSKNKGRSREGKLKRITCALAVIFVVLAVVLNVKF